MNKELPSSNQKLPLLEWVLERFENCCRIARQKEEPADRDSWMEDAEYFRQILVVLSGKQPSGRQPVETSQKQWRCFHCDEVFTNSAEAALHFGETIYSEPFCQVITAKELRTLQSELASYREEDTGLHREIQRLQADHATALRREEEKGYARALRDTNYKEPSPEEPTRRIPPREFDIESHTGLYTEPTAPRGKPCTCDNCLGSSASCRVEAGERLGDLWYCRKRAEKAK